MSRLPLAVLLLAAGCAPTAPASGSEAPAPPPSATEAVDGPIRLGVGETVERGTHTLTFNGVAEDSRCLEDVECVWGGRATVYVEADGELFTLTLPYSGQQPEEVSTVAWAGTTWELTGLTPYPGSEAARRDEAVALTLTPVP